MAYAMDDKPSSDIDVIRRYLSEALNARQVEFKNLNESVKRLDVLQRECEYLRKTIELLATMSLDVPTPTGEPSAIAWNQR